MKSIGIKIVTLVAILFFSVSTFAQQGNKMTTEQRAEKRVQKLHQVCNLTTQQQTSVKQLYVAKATQEPAKLKGKKSPQQRQAIQQRRKAATQKFQSDLKATLTPQQWTKWEAYKKEQKANRQKK